MTYLLTETTTTMKQENNQMSLAKLKVVFSAT